MQYENCDFRAFTPRRSSADQQSITIVNNINDERFKKMARQKTFHKTGNKQLKKRQSNKSGIQLDLHTAVFNAFSCACA